MRAPPIWRAALRPEMGFAPARVTSAQALHPPARSASSCSSPQAALDSTAFRASFAMRTARPPYFQMLARFRPRHEQRFPSSASCSVSESSQVQRFHTSPLSLLRFSPPRRATKDVKDGTRAGGQPGSGDTSNADGLHTASGKPTAVGAKMNPARSRNEAGEIALTNTSASSGREPNGSLRSNEATRTTSATGAPQALSEDILTLPNILTILRLASTPVLGYLVVQGHMEYACVLLFVSGLTDVLDGWIARARGSYTVFGSIADPAADKALMTVMVLALAYRELLPASLVALILGRDIALVISAFFVRYRTLPEPKTFSRYFNPRLPSATVTPTQLSKYNTFLQLLLVGGATLLPITPDWFQQASHTPWNFYMALVAITTVWSGLGYLGGGGSAKFLGNKAREVAAKRFKSNKGTKP